MGCKTFRLENLLIIELIMEVKEIIYSRKTKKNIHYQYMKME